MTLPENQMLFRIKVRSISSKKIGFEKQKQQQLQEGKRERGKEGTEKISMKEIVFEKPKFIKRIKIGTPKSKYLRTQYLLILF